MRKLSLPAVLVVAGALFLATAASALAAFTPHIAGSTAGPKTTIHITAAKADDSIAHISIIAPGVATLGQAPGTTIGAVTASVNAKAISPDAVIPLTGNTIVADGSSAALQAAGTQCTGVAQHAAVWNLSLTAAGQTLNVPVYVDPTTGSKFAPLGATILQTCLASPDVGAACAATLCAKLLDVDFTVAGVFAAPTQQVPTWLGIFTPFAAGTANPNVAGTVSALGLDAKPVITLTAKAGKGGKVVIAGKAAVLGQPAAALPIAILDGAKKVGSTTVTTAGTFVKTLTLKKGKHTLIVGTAVPTDQDITSQGACALIPAGAGLPPCVTASLAAFVATSNTVKVTVK